MTDEELNIAIINKLGSWNYSMSPMGMFHSLERGDKLSSVESLIAQGVKLMARQLMAEKYGKK